MDGAIRHLRCTYRSLGDDRAEAAGAAHRLDRIARAELAARYDVAMDVAMGAQPDVYVLRNVHTSTAIAAYASLTDGAIAETLARRMAASVVRTIRDDPGDGANMVRFASQEEFVAQFVVALADGTAWSRWYFFPFRSLRELPASRAIRTVLIDNRDCLPHVLAALRRAGCLERVFRNAGSEELDALWSVGLRRDGGVEPDALRPLFAAAVTLLDRLGLWSGAHPSAAELDRLFSVYLATAPAPGEWNDRRALALVVLEVIRFLAARGSLRVPSHDVDVALHAADALRDLDWLDADYLAAHLIPSLSAAPLPRPLPPVRDLTPRQQRLVADLLELLTTGAVVLDPADPAGTANRLQLFAALIERSPQWADDDLARTAVDNVLVAWTWLAESDAPGVVVDRLRREGVERAVEAGPHDAVAGGVKAVRFVAAILGASATADVLTALVRRGHVHQDSEHAWSLPAKHSAEGDSDTSHLATRCAGVFLLSRAVLDAHLPAIAASVGDPVGGMAVRLDILLASIALRWGGAAGLVTDDGDTYLDEGISLFAGLARSPTINELREACVTTGADAHVVLQEAVFAMLAGLRAVGGSTLHVHEVPLGPSHTALIAGSESGDIWPLGAVVDAGTCVPAVRRWIDAWTGVFGNPPAIVVGNRRIHQMLTAAGIAAVLADGPIPEESESPVAETRRSHDASRDALGRALDAISAGQLALPDADLAVGLIAISLLRLWARWLGRFADSTAPYLLERFIRRAGDIEVDAAGLIVSLEARPLDVVLDMAGYTAAVARIPWLGDRALRFERAAAP